MFVNRYFEVFYFSSNLLPEICLSSQLRQNKKFQKAKEKKQEITENTEKEPGKPDSFMLLFTHCANSNGFYRCFAFQIGKICYHHCIIRHFQFRKCLPVYSNVFISYFAYCLIAVSYRLFPSESITTITGKSRTSSLRIASVPRSSYAITSEDLIRWESRAPAPPTAAK